MCADGFKLTLEESRDGSANRTISVNLTSAESFVLMVSCAVVVVSWCLT